VSAASALSGALIAQESSEKIAACGPTADQSWACSTVYEITGSRDAAEVADTLAEPLQIFFIVLIAILSAWLARRVIRRLSKRIAAAPELGPLGGARRSQRVETIGHVMSSIVTVFIFVIAVFVIMGELGLEIAPMVAGAGVVGVALGFGAQSIVRDFLSGFFMVVEDQFGVGDVIDVGGVQGEVEEFTLRVTRLRDVEGNVWHVPNGSVLRVGNKSQQWSRAVVDITVGFDVDLTQATELIKRLADEMWHEDRWTDVILSEPEVWPAESLVAEGAVMRTVVKTKPHEQWNVGRELRTRIIKEFDDAGIVIRGR
jgi:moderate conductance mechanosensitive channel